MKTPPGVSSSDFTAALQRFHNIVGADWVFTKDEDVDLYKDAYSPFRGDAEQERFASAAVAPDRVEQVQEIVRTANQYKIPLYTISTGKNLTYGGSAPVYSGSVVLDLKRMNRVLEVNEKSAYCLVEPGVSFFELFRHVREHNLQVRLSLPDPGWGSPIGNALEHGVGYHFNRDHFRSHCGMEVVLANGELLRTGMGAVPNSPSWQRHPYGFGPYIDGIFSQSNFGVVTKMGFHMLPEPEVTRVFDVSIAKFDDLDAFLEEVSLLEDSKVLDCNGSLRMPLLSTSRPDSKALLEQPGGASAAAWDELGSRQGVAPWLMTFNIQGPDKIVQAHYDYVVERLSRFTGFKVAYSAVYPRGIDPEQVPNRDKAVLGIPSMQVFAGVGVSRLPGHTDFSPVFPMTGDAVRRMNAALQKGCKESGIEWRGWQGGNGWFPKTLIMIYGFPVSYDPAENSRIRSGFRHLIDLMAAEGFTEYRTHPAFQDYLMSKYSFNNNILRRFHETVKDAVDPNGILSAGKNGVWPQHLRAGRVA